MFNQGLTSAQICQRSSNIAKNKGGLAVAGQWLNVILAELCQTYDFEICRGAFSSNFNPSLSSSAAFPNNTPGSGPYALPNDFLRCNRDDVQWFLSGVPYQMIAVDMSEYDQQVQQAGIQSYPVIFATDLSLNQSTPVAVVWPPPAGAYPYLVRFFRQMSDIGSNVAQGSWNPGNTSPELSSTIPWFPNQNYLITRVAGELMKETSDERWESFLGESDFGAQGILDRYLKKKDDQDDRAKRVTLDARRFGRNFSRMPPTKNFGW